jgi:hypothetical protein
MRTPVCGWCKCVAWVAEHKQLRLDRTTIQSIMNQRISNHNSYTDTSFIFELITTVCVRHANEDTVHARVRDHE